MFPAALDLARLPAALVGNGAVAARRLAQLDAFGAKGLQVFSDAPSKELAALTGPRLQHRLPNPADLAACRVIFIVDLSPAAASRLAAEARAAGLLVHVEDRLDLTDFHIPAVVRRGDLVIAVSTGGRSPALASRLRRFMEQLFAAEWAERLAEIATLRGRLKSAGASNAAVAAATDRLIDANGWLPPIRPSAARPTVVAAPQRNRHVA